MIGTTLNVATKALTRQLSAIATPGKGATVAGFSADSVSLSAGALMAAPPSSSAAQLAMANDVLAASKIRAQVRAEVQKHRAKIEMLKGQTQSKIAETMKNFEIAKSAS